MPCGNTAKRCTDRAHRVLNAQILLIDFINPQILEMKRRFKSELCVDVSLGDLQGWELFQVVALVLLQFLRRKVTALLDELANTFFHSGPLHRNFRPWMVAHQSQPGVRAVISDTRCAIQECMIAAGISIFLFERSNRVFGRNVPLIHGENPQPARILPQNRVNFCLGNGRSRGRVRALCFSNGLHLLPLGRDFRGHKT